MRMKEAERRYNRDREMFMMAMHLT